MMTKKILFITYLALIMLSPISSQSNINNKENTIDKKVEVFYFHYSRRCATCNAIESVAKETIEEFHNDNVIFADFNMDEKEGKTKSKELEITGQTLMIFSDNEKINITNEAFMNARSNPEKLKQIIKEKITTLL